VNNIEETYCRSVCEAAVVLSSTRSPKKQFGNLVERVAKTVGAKGCALMLFSPDKKRLFHINAYGLSERHIKKGPVLADNSIAEALQGKSVAVLNAAEDERTNYREEAEREGIASILTVPMILRNEIIGVIRLYTAEPHQFSEDDKYIASIFASLAAVALKNEKWYLSVKRDNEKLKQELMEITHLLNS
jgi:GAF domain-containing protein